ncbi:MAG: DUF3418 domain-containing protein, partial [Propionibacteriaceae bacterium]|nr:DUF3418 domain-containing protein [Propionibacteriaceae bacterium]
PPGVGFPQALSRAVRALRGVEVPDDAWRPDDVPEHLKVRFRVTTPEGSAAVGRDLSELEARLRPQLARAINDAASRWTHPGAVEWRFGELPPRVGGEVVGFPALVDRGDRVAAEVFPDPEPAAASHRAGLRRLIALTTVDPVKAVVARLGNPVKFALAASPYPTVPALLADARLKAIDDLMGADVSAVRDEAAFTALRDKVRGDVAARMQAVVDTAGAVVGLWREVEAKLPGAPPAARDDMAEQLKSLVYPGFILASAEPFYERLPVYLQAMLRRVEQAAANPERDAARQAEVAAIEDAYAELCAAHSVLPPEMVELGWLVEELRVGVFAQGLGTIRPVSAARLRKAMAALAGR